MASRKRQDVQGVSPELDELSCELMGQAFDLLADGQDVDVMLVVGDSEGNAASYVFSDDGEEACLQGARDKVRELRRTKGDESLHLGVPRYYALCYVGAVADEEGPYADALIMEFGERGRVAYSAYSLFEGRGTGDGFCWSDPAPAGEVDALL